MKIISEESDSDSAESLFTLETPSTVISKGKQVNPKLDSCLADQRKQNYKSELPLLIGHGCNMWCNQLQRCLCIVANRRDTIKEQYNEAKVI